MPKRIIQLINKEFSSINQAALLLGFFAFLSQILGLIRDRALAHYLGASESLDIYYASFRIPDFLFVSIASLFAVTVILPFLTERIGQREDGSLNHNSIKAKSFFSELYTVFLIIMILASIVLFLAMPYLSGIVAPGFGEAANLELIAMGRIMLLSPILLGLSNLFGSITQLFRKFFVFALSPVFYNLGILAGIFLFYPQYGVSGLAWGVILGALLHLAIQLPVIVRHGFLPRLKLKINWLQVKTVLKLSIPRTLGLSFYNLAILALVAFASTIKEGSISIFNFAFNLQSVPITIIGLSYSVAAFPTLARYFSASDYKSFINHIRVAMRQIIFWSLPVAFLLIVLRAQIIRVILGSGQFSWEDTRLTAAMLAIFVVAVVAQSLNTLLVRAFYAAGKTWRPLWVNLIGAVLIIGLAKVLLLAGENTYVIQFFERILRVQNIPGTRILMLGLAYAIGIIINFFALWYFLKKEMRQYIESNFVRTTFFQSFLASFVAAVVAYFGLNIFDDIFNLNTFWGILMQGLISGLFGLAAWILVLKLVKNQEFSDIWQTFHTRFWKVKPVVAPQEKL